MFVQFSQIDRVKFVTLYAKRKKSKGRRIFVDKFAKMR